MEGEHDERVIETAKGEMGRRTARSGRTSATCAPGAPAHLLDGLFVEYTAERRSSNGAVNAPEATLLVIQPYDKTALQAIERAIHTSDLGLKPQNDGKIIRVPIPALTEERRKELVKHVRKIAEDYRVSVRNHRRDALEMLKELEKDKEITQDDHRHAHDKVEALTKEYIEKVDKAVKTKEDEIMAV
jgi:ribosome recycling factor